jgi:hypothetical protein
MLIHFCHAVVLYNGVTGVSRYNGMAPPQVADEGKSPEMEGDCEYIDQVGVSKTVFRALYDGCRNSSLSRHYFCFVRVEKPLLSSNLTQYV